ncbi:3',5'-cyclic-AMP phosphodiesterase [Pseudomonas sp. R5(2019)]|uniref:3',5'-cyclic-AMP phosphodiesterase n=1 Tax=Pseudomonas sp. R5(2019) TaxID=2697566 RepID=UPI0014133190|nr:3',5'-cyclic-AMP phosphodiesterase [Pseudomonas sp. R5(2019)]NBA93943.1 3',5'-cyclic-AMP phosphodiesterase [Pseudomonas sp. R5(2019)]
MSNPLNPIAEAPVTLVQLSDSHLFAEAQGTLLGMNTADSLSRVVDQVLAEQPRIDLVLATGDLTQDGTPASYQRFAAQSARLSAPVRWLCGNHDEPQAMARVGGAPVVLDPIVDLGNWRVVLLNSAITGAVPGYLDETQLERLTHSLEQAPERHHLICLHHQPVDIRCAWMAPIGLRNPDDLFAVLDRFPQVRAVLWGHIHQEWDQLRNGVRLLASPSTCVQFLPHSDDFKIDVDQAPGYRWLRLHTDGQLETGVSRISGFSFTVDYGDGY